VHLSGISVKFKVNCRSSGPQIGFVLKKFAPFLKLYTDYIKNFDNATSLITLWTTKSSKFMAFLEELQVCFCCTFHFFEFCLVFGNLHGWEVIMALIGCHVTSLSLNPTETCIS